jgi:hypothetical protein
LARAYPDMRVRNVDGLRDPNDEVGPHAHGVITFDAGNGQGCASERRRGGLRARRFDA